jgi:hypothetical protein
MKKKLLICSLVAMMMAAAPTTMQAGAPVAPGIEQVEDEVEIKVEEQTVTVYGAQGQTLEVVSLTGRRVMTIKIETPAQRVELNLSKGCYILKVGKVVRKVSVR